MPMVATKHPYTLFVVTDVEPINPRNDYERFGKMICFHRRYALGDEHAYNEPREFLQNLLYDAYSSKCASQYGKPIYDYIKNGHAKGARLEYNRSSREWELLENDWWGSGKNWSSTSSYSASLKGKDIPNWFLDDALSALKMNELMELVRGMEDLVILPLYLYDHSGLTMNATGFSCPWDSGQVGWIYADRDRMQKEYGLVTSEILQQTKDLLLSEVKEYNDYLTGQCYGFRLFKGAEEVDSCWGFIGEMSDVQNAIKEHLPKECSDIMGLLQFCSNETIIE